MTYEQYQDAKQKVIDKFKDLNTEYEKHMTEGDLNLMAESYLKEMGIDKPL
jgi:hypothetical protein